MFHSLKRFVLLGTLLCAVPFASIIGCGGGDSGTPGPRDPQPNTNINPAANDFGLTVSESTVVMKPHDTHEVTVGFYRGNDYRGFIVTDFKNLPQGVSASEDDDNRSDDFVHYKFITQSDVIASETTITLQGDGWTGDPTQDTTATKDGHVHSVTFQLKITAANEAAVCGDGKIGAGEECDGTNLNGGTCAALGKGSDGKALIGTPTCDPVTCELTTVGCKESSGTVYQGTCGDQKPDTGETCDGNTVECTDLKDKDGNPLYKNGAAICKGDCKGWDIHGCQLITNTAKCPAGANPNCEFPEQNNIDCQVVDPKYTGGTASCNSACALDVSTCAKPLNTDCTVDIACTELDPNKYSSGEAVCKNDGSYDETSCVAKSTTTEALQCPQRSAGDKTTDGRTIVHVIDAFLTPNNGSTDTFTFKGNEVYYIEIGNSDLSSNGNNIVMEAGTVLCFASGGESFLIKKDPGNVVGKLTINGTSDKHVLMTILPDQTADSFWGGVIIQDWANDKTPEIHWLDIARAGHYSSQAAFQVTNNNGVLPPVLVDHLTLYEIDKKAILMEDSTGFASNSSIIINSYSSSGHKDDESTPPVLQINAAAVETLKSSSTFQVGSGVPEQLRVIKITSANFSTAGGQADVYVNFRNLELSNGRTIYRTSGNFAIDDDNGMVVEPGVTLQLPDYLLVGPDDSANGHGQLLAVGSQEKPIIFDFSGGVSGEHGHGIVFQDSSLWESTNATDDIDPSFFPSVIQHAKILHAGAPISGNSTYRMTSNSCQKLRSIPGVSYEDIGTSITLYPGTFKGRNDKSYPGPNISYTTIEDSLGDGINFFYPQKDGLQTNYLDEEHHNTFVGLNPFNFDSDPVYWKTHYVSMMPLAENCL